MKTSAVCALLALCVGAASSASAADVSFPNADGKGDLASPASWGLSEIPDSSSRPVFAQSMDLTASADVTFAGLGFTKGGITLNFDLTNEASQATAANPRRLTFPGYFSFMNYHDLTVRVVGGIWDFQTTGGFTMYGNYGNCYNDRIYFENCIITNARSLKAGYGGSGIVYSIGRGAKVHTCCAGSCGYQSVGLLEVKDGGQLYVATTGDQNDFNLCNSGVELRGNVIRVSGAGSILKVTGKSGINLPSGGNPAGELFHVTDHGYAHLGTGAYKCFGCAKGAYSEIKLNRWVIDDGGVLYTTGTAINMAQNGTAGALLLVGDGGICTNACALNIGSDYSFGASGELCVSNGFYRGGLPYIGYYSAASSNCGMRITGPRARVELTNKDSLCLFGKGSRCHFVMDDHAVWTNSLATYFNGNVDPKGSNHVFEVRGGARYVSTNNLEIATVNYRSWYNTIRVADGGRLECGILRTSSIGNTLAVSNGTVSASSVSWCYLSQSPVIDGFSNCWIRVQGSTPRLDVAKGLSVNYSSTISYELVPEGYAEGHVPVAAKTMTIPAGCRLRARGLDAVYAANGLRRRIYTLAETTGGITLGKGVLGDANAALRADCTKAYLSRLKLSDDGKRLLLDVRGPQATLLFLR